MMGLRKKTLLIVAGTSLGLVVVLSVLGSTILMRGFTHIQEAKTLNELHELLAVVNSRQDGLERSASDYAEWDETCDFVARPNQAYLESNYSVGTYERLELCAVVIADRKGVVKFARGLEAETKKETEVPAELLGLVSGEGRLEADKGATGIVRTSMGPMLMTARPILGTDGVGESRGLLLWAMKMRASLLDSTGERDYESPGVVSFEDLDKFPEYARAVGRMRDLTEETPMSVRASGPHQMSVYGVLKDVFGRPAVVVRAQMSRDIYWQGLAAVTYFTVALLVVGGVSVVVVTTMVDRVVLRRLAVLSDEIRRIGESEDLSARVSVRGADELGRLGQATNATLERLEISAHKTHEAQEELRQAHAQLEIRVQERTAELKSANEQLKESARLIRENQQQQRALLDNIPDMAWLKDPEGRYIAVNEPFTQACGRTSEQIVGGTDVGLWPEELARKYRTDDAQVVKNGKRMRVEEPIVQTHGREIWAETVKTPVFDDTGRVLGTVGIARDMTDRKRMEEDRQKFVALVENSSDFIGIADLEGKVFYVNPAGCRLVGLAGPEQAVGRTILDFMDDATRKGSGEEIIAALGEGKAITGEGRLQRFGSGETIDVQYNAFIVRSPETSQPICMAGVLRDITERKRAEQEIRRSYRFQTVLNELLHISLEDLSLLEVLQRSLQQVMSVEDLGLETRGALFLTEQSSARLVLVTQQGMNEELLQRCANVEFGHCLCGRAAVSQEMIVTEGLDENHEVRLPGMSEHGHCCVPILSPTRKTLGVLNLYLARGTQPDVKQRAFLEAAANVLAGIIERKRGEETVRRARTEAEVRAKELAKVNRQLSRAMDEKEDFLRAVSHDLSAPLRNIAGMANYLKGQYGDRLDDSGRDRLERILRNVTLQDGLIKDLLELSRIRSRRTRFEPVALADVVRGLVEQFSFDLEKKSGEISIAGQLPVLWCEPNRMRQLFLNLLDNAIKYSHPERPLSIAISCARRQGMIEFSVRDNGIGISREDTEKIFYVFRRARNAHTAKVEGKGVGLASVRTIVETYGGEIHVESLEGQGSTFMFTLPAALLEPPAVSANEHEDVATEASKTPTPVTPGTERNGG